MLIELAANRDYDALLARVGESRIVLLGEASHGTHEFYSERAGITRRLIDEKGFTAVAVEADWPDAYRVNRYVRGTGSDLDADTALSGFKRFPTWMWRNRDVVAFATWLRERNAAMDPDERSGFYGLDLYSLYTSIGEVIAYLERTDPEAAARARDRYACFDHFGKDSQAYAYATHAGMAEPCEAAVVAQLLDLRARAADSPPSDARERDDVFSAEQNARLARNAERYYRTMFGGGVSSWNQRDRHMMETLEALDRHLSRPGAPAKIVVWEHNSHVGDARVTQMGREGEFNVGQLARERYGSEAVLVGFTTYTGWVTAASGWDAPAERKWVRPALAESFEAQFHHLGRRRFILIMDDGATSRFGGTRLERAIGVIYKPETERMSHYFKAALTAQFDVVIHIDETTAVEPLERSTGWDRGEVPETYPFAV